MKKLLFAVLICLALVAVAAPALAAGGVISPYGPTNTGGGY